MINPFSEVSAALNFIFRRYLESGKRQWIAYIRNNYFNLLDRDFPKPPPGRFFENLSIAQNFFFRQKCVCAFSQKKIQRNCQISSLAVSVLISRFTTFEDFHTL
jgi:hypothetical protein